jgi:hypothetical protein
MQLTEEHKAAIAATPYNQMVAKLAKPGADILATLTPERFEMLAGVCSTLVNAGNNLDVAKKVAIYNKVVAPAPEQAAFGRDLADAFLLLTPEKVHLLHMAIGLAGEAAEMLDQVANHVFHDAPLDAENVVEEGGDATFYVCGLALGIGSSLEEMQAANKVKLLTGEKARYKLGMYTDTQAIARADKVEA